MKKLVHPNIVQLVEVIDAPLDSFLYIVMEYVARGAVMRCIEPERGRYASPITGEICLCCWQSFRGFCGNSSLFFGALLRLFRNYVGAVFVCKTDT